MSCIMNKLKTSFIFTKNTKKSQINIEGCIELNDLAVQYISGVCRHLCFINISGIPNVSKRSIRFLKKVEF